MAQPWYDDPITQAHGHGEDGIDLGTPNDTTLNFPEGGQVIDASYHVYGGQVVVHMPEGWDEYFIHMDKIYVKPGDTISAGEIVGTSGGGIGDLVLHDGSVQPAQAQSWYDGHSSGYHTEFGLFEDTSNSGSMGQFNKGWGNPSRQRDPTPIIAELHSGILTMQPTGAQIAPGINVPNPATAAQNAVSGAFSNAVTSLGFSSPQNMLQRVTVGAVGVLVALAGLYVAGAPQINAAVQSAQANAAKAAKTAAKVAAV